MRIAIVGSGVSGLVAAYLLQRNHDITVFEAADYAGGHAHTVDLTVDGSTHHVDTAFVVFNELAYPNFVKLLDRLNVPSQLSDMSFSVQCEQSGMEYASRSINALFCQRRNLLSPRFLRMVYDIRRFFRESSEVLAESSPDVSLGDYLRERGYSEGYVDGHLLPMASAIWSAGLRDIRDFPVDHFVRFFANHGFLQFRDRPPWRTIRGGSRMYVDAITAGFRDRIRLSTPVRRIRRGDDGVAVHTSESEETFDKVVLAVHGDLALSMIEDPSDDERKILSAFRYQDNDTVLHQDAKLLPRRRAAWASWNYFKPARPAERPTVTYCMNRLQSLVSREPICVSLNRTAEIDRRSIAGSFSYRHPQYDREAFAAQAKRDLISGKRHTFYCGAYWGYGFHEDGVRSGLDVAAKLGEKL